jgi:AraC-like DNA-binding protein
MSKIDQPDPGLLLSQQVTDARYFFLGLAPRRPARLELVMGGFEHCQPDYVVSRTHYPYSTIEYIVAGHGHAIVNRRRLELGPGAIFAYGPSTHHEIRTAPNHVLIKYFISLTGTAVPATLRRCKIPPGHSRQLNPHAEIAGVFDHLLREGQRSGPRRLPLCQTLFQLLLLKIEDAASLTAHPNERAREAFLRCKEFIDTEAENLRTLAEIARAVGAEASTICRWFRRYQGTSPYQYLLRRRMNLAAEKLVEHGGLVKQVALRLGFADPFHFSHQFKAIHGIPPSALLRYNRAKGAAS